MTGNLSLKRFRLDLVDRITILYILLTALLLVTGTGIYENVATHYMVRAGMLLFILLMASIAKRYPGKLTNTLHYLYPLIFISYFFKETDYLNNLFMDDLDPVIISFEKSFFGFMPSEAFSGCCPQVWFSELMHLGYFSFYLLMLFFIVYYAIKLPSLAAKRIFVFYQSFYLFYLIFIFFPSAGPQYFLPGSETVVPGGYFFTDIMNKILFYGDGSTGAFPSSHVGMTWLMMYFLFRDSRKMFFLWLIPAILLTFSTVYIKAHYAVDVIAGIIIVPGLIVLGKSVYGYFRVYNDHAKKYSSA